MSIKKVKWVFASLQLKLKFNTRKRFGTESELNNCLVEFGFL